MADCFFYMIHHISDMWWLVGWYLNDPTRFTVVLGVYFGYLLCHADCQSSRSVLLLLLLVMSLNGMMFEEPAPLACVGFELSLTPSCTHIL